MFLTRTAYKDSVIPLEPAAGRLEREHNIQSRGEWEGSEIVKLSKTEYMCCTIGGIRGDSAFGFLIHVCSYILRVRLC